MQRAEPERGLAFLQFTSGKVCNINFTVAENAPNFPTNFPVKFCNSYRALAGKSCLVTRSQSPADASAGDPRGRCLTLKPPLVALIEHKNKLQRLRNSSTSRTFCIKIQDMASIARPSLLFRQMTDRCPQEMCTPKLLGCCWGCLKVVLQNADFPCGRRAYCGPCPVLWKQIPVVICTLRRISPGPSFPERFSPDGAESAAVRTHRNG